VELRRLIPGDAIKSIRNIHAYASHVEITSHGRIFEVAWSTIRRHADPELVSEFAKAAKQERHVVGLRLGELRRKTGITARAVARRAGISPQSLSRIENGRHDLILSTLQGILAAMDSSMEEFIEG